MRPRGNDETLCDTEQTRLAAGPRVFKAAEIPLLPIFRGRAGIGPARTIRNQEQAMTMNKDQVKGRVKEAKGAIKEAAGKLVGNETLEAKGKVQRTLGKAQAKFGDVKQDVKDAANKA
jgi:uncharacterized protein YjbJ (UPF0337 family)